LHEKGVDHFGSVGRGIADRDGIGDRSPLFHDAADVVGTIWLNGLRMTVIPLVVALLITGIVQTANAASAGRTATRSV
jgi:proton glutamate symport protein